MSIPLTLREYVKKIAESLSTASDHESATGDWLEIKVDVGVSYSGEHVFVDPDSPNRISFTLKVKRL